MAGVKNKILVIDDDSNVRDYLMSLFEEHGYIVQTAADAQDGLKKAKINIPDLITLDIEMPGEWGPRFYQHLTKDKKLQSIPVIVISGLAGHETAVVKAVASIAKPFDPDQLIAVVKQTLRNRYKIT